MAQTPENEAPRRAWRCPTCKAYGRPRINCPDCDGSGFQRAAAPTENATRLWGRAPRNYAEQRALLEDSLRSIPLE